MSILYHIVALMIATLLGGISSFSFAPYGYIIASFISLCGLFIILYKVRSSWWRFWALYCFSAAKFLLSLYWVSHAPQIFSEQLQHVALAALIGLPLLMACITSLPALFLFMWKKHYVFMATSLAISLGDYALTLPFGGFPWNIHAHYITPNIYIAQSLALFGQYMLGLLYILSAEIVMLVIVKRRFALLLLLLMIIWGGLYFYGWQRLDHADNANNITVDASNKPVTLRIVQANIPQKEKWDQDFFVPFLKRYLNMSFQDDSSKIDAVIWPEMAITQDITNDARLREFVSSLLSPNQYLLTGGVEDADDGIYNSVFALGYGGVIEHTYRKSHLVPFGEYVPLGDYLPLEQLSINYINDLQQGVLPTIFALPAIGRMLPTICFEAIFPIYAWQARAEHADFMVNFTNDAWFGYGIGPKQHVHIASLRSIESGVPTIRVAVTGISGVIDAYGRTINMLPRGQKITRDVTVPPKLEYAPFYYSVKDYGYLITLVVLLMVSFVFINEERK